MLKSGMQCARRVKVTLEPANRPLSRKAYVLISMVVYQSRFLVRLIETGERLIYRANLILTVINLKHGTRNCPDKERKIKPKNKG